MNTANQTQAEQTPPKDFSQEDRDQIKKYLSRMSNDNQALQGEASILVKKINRILARYDQSLSALADHPEWLLGQGDTGEMEERLNQYVTAYNQTVAKTKPLINENALLRAENQKLKDKLSFRKKITDEFSRKASAMTSGLGSLFKSDPIDDEEKRLYASLTEPLSEENKDYYKNYFARKRREREEERKEERNKERVKKYEEVYGLTQTLRNSGWFLGPWMALPDYIYGSLAYFDRDDHSFRSMAAETILQSITSAIVGSITVGLLNIGDIYATWQFKAKPAYEEAIKTCEGKIGQTCITNFRGFPYYMPWLPFSDERTLERELRADITDRVDLPQTGEARITYIFNVKEFKLESSTGIMKSQIESGAKIYYVPMTPTQATPIEP